MRKEKILNIRKVILIYTDNGDLIFVTVTQVIEFNIKLLCFIVGRYMKMFSYN